MSVDFASRLLPTNLSYVIHSLIKRLRGGITEDYYRKGRYIVYPRGSNSKIFEALASTPGLGIRLGSRLERLETDGDRIQSAVVSGAGIRADLYLSTIPISSMAGLVDRSLPLAPWEKLKYRGVLILIVKLKRTRVLEGLWTWFPEPKYRFYRISEFKNALPELAPPDKTLLAVEIACNVDDPFWSLDAAQVFSAVAPDLRELYGLESSEVIGLDLKKSPHAYPVLAKATEATQRVLTHQTPFSNLFIAGRTGMFQYRMLEGCYESAVECVAEMVSAIHGEQPSLKSTVGVDRFGRPQVVPE
jgi:protoporphyrinogen oxidase